MFYDIEEIIGHRLLPNGKHEYLVKWKNYGPEFNSWEPRKSFLSPQIVDDYHSRMKSTDILSNSGMENGNQDGQIRTYIKASDMLSGQDIEKRGLKPQKIHNIFHIHGNEKILVAVMQFSNRTDLAFVRTTWANVHCPQLVIQFYESRIFWREKSTGRMIKGSYAQTA